MSARQPRPGDIVRVGDRTGLLVEIRDASAEATRTKVWDPDAHDFFHSFLSDLTVVAAATYAVVREFKGGQVWQREGSPLFFFAIESSYSGGEVTFVDNEGDPISKLTEPLTLVFDPSAVTF